MAQYDSTPEHLKDFTSVQTVPSLSSQLYEQLRNRRNIRLLRLWPKDSSKEIRCDIYEASLDDLDPVDGTPQFEALSYAWGTELDSHHVICNGSTLAVSRNLHSALSQLQTDKTRIMWADAICINQLDIAEKNIQVPLIGEVYRRAHTIVWLGAAEDSQDGAFIMSLLLKFARVQEIIFEKGEDLVSNTRVLPHALRAVGMDYQDLASLPWRSIYAFFCRPWFQRVWVNQEIALSYTSTVRAGEQSLSVPDLESAIRLIGSLEGAIIKSPETDLREKFLDMLAKHKQDRMQAYRTIRSSVLLSRKQELYHDLRTVSFLGQSQTKDPRDHIYGLLSALTDPADHAVDYAKSIVEVYTDFAWHCLQSSQDLMVLSEDTTQRTGKVRERKRHLAHLRSELPSWCPDWSGTRNDHARMLVSTIEMIMLDQWKASGGRTLEAARPTPTTLRLRGMLVDVVESVAVEFPTVPDLGYGPLMTVADPKDGFLPWEQLVASKPSWPDGLSAAELMQNLLWFDWDISDDTWLDKTLNSTERDRSLPYSPPNISSIFSCWANKYTTGLLAQLPLVVPDIPPKHHDAVADIAMAHASYCNRGTTIFATQRGYIGTALPGVSPGDLVCVLYGGAVPYILRSSRNGDDAYSFLGECYIEGMMRGEALNLDGVAEKDFVLI